MRKLLIIIALLLIAVPSYATTEMGYTAAMHTSLTTADTNNDTAYEEYKTRMTNQACGSTTYGLSSAILYKVTGDSAYCTRSFNDSSDCVSGANRNKTRDCFTERALAYSICGDVVSGGNKASWESDLDYMVTAVQSSSHDTRTWDTDELIGHYFGCSIYDIAKDNNDFTVCTSTGGGIPWGGIDVTGDNFSTIRNAVGKHWADYGNGTWVESSEYNRGTVFYAMIGVHALNDYYGVDKFPEITTHFDELAEYIKNSFTPDLSQYHHWGDTQSGDVRQVLDQKMRQYIAGIAFNDSHDANLWSIWDSLYEDGCTRDWLMFYDDDTTRTAMTGQTDFYASEMGISFWHEGWNTNDTFIATEYFPIKPADHDTDVFGNMEIWKNDGYILTNPKHYYGGRQDAPNWHNGVLAFGAYAGLQEAKGPMAHQFGSDYVYHAGVTSGFQTQSNRDNAVPPFIDESSSQNLVRENGDGTTTAFMYNRVRACNPSSTSCMTSSKYDRLAEYFSTPYHQRMSANSYKHSFSLFMDASPSKSGDKFSWTDADTSTAMELYTFMDSYTNTTITMSSQNHCKTPYWFCAMGPNPTEWGGYNLRLNISTTNGYTLYPILNVLHAGGAGTYTEIQEEAGSNEEVQGAMVETSTERIVALFSAEDKIPTFTSAWGPEVNWRSTYDPQRFTKAEAMSHFTEGAVVEVFTDDSKDIEVFILGLDHNSSWTVDYQVDDGGYGSNQCSVSNEGVCTFTIIGGSGTYDIRWTESGASPPDCDDDCDLCGTEGACDGSDLNTPTTTCYWHNNDGATDTQCNYGQADSDLCAAGDRSKCTETTCEANEWCWENSQCALTCEPVPAEFETTIYAASDILMTSTTPTTNLDTTGLGVKVASASSLSYGDVCSGACDNCDSRTVSCTVTSCTNPVMVIHVGTEETGDTTPNSVTWNGDAATLGRADTYWGGEKSSLYYLLNPDVGTYDLVATFDGSSSVDIILGMQVICGVVQQAPEASCAGEHSCLITTVTDNAVIISGVSNVTNSANTVAGGITTKSYDGNTPAWGMNTTLGYGQASGNGEYTCGYTNGLTGNRSGSACLAFEIASSGSGEQKTSCMTFDTSSLPDELIVRDADITLTTSGATSGTGAIEIFPGLRTWVEDEATWNIYSTGNSWQTAGGTGALDVSASNYSIYTLAGDGGDVGIEFNGNASLISAVQENTGVGESINICVQQTGSESVASFYDSEDGTESNRPNIVVSYDSEDEPVEPVRTPKRTWNSGKFYGQYGG